MSLGTSFTLFPNLPHELQKKIWHFALPSSYQSMVYPYHFGGWVPRSLDPSEEDIYDRNRGTDVEIVFQPQRLNSPQLDLRPLLHSSHDARKVAHSWLGANGFTHHHSTVWRRSFNHDCDALLLTFEGVCDVMDERTERREQARLDDGFRCPDFVGSVVLSVQTLTSIDPIDIVRLFESCSNLQTILVVWDKLQFGEGRSWWEFTRAPGGIFRWNPEHRSFEFVGSRNPAVERIYQAIEQALPNLSPDLAALDLPQIEMVPCFTSDRSSR